MEVEFAFLADSAQAASDGKLYALGAGIDRIRAESFPVLHPLLTFVLKLRVHPLECGREHTLEVELWDPDGHCVGPRLSMPFRAERDEKHPTRPCGAQLVMNMLTLEFDRPGDYAFEVLVDGQHIKTVPLYIDEVGGEERRRGSEVARDQT